jgi:hypothetical protein
MDYFQIALYGDRQDSAYALKRSPSDSAIWRQLKSIADHPLGPEVWRWHDLLDEHIALIFGGKGSRLPLKAPRASMRLH